MCEKTKANSASDTTSEKAAAIVVILSSSAGSLFKSCVLGQDTLLSEQCPSPPGQVH